MHVRCMGHGVLTGVGRLPGGGLGGEPEGSTLRSALKGSVLAAKAEATQGKGTVLPGSRRRPQGSRPPRAAVRSVVVQSAAVARTRWEEDEQRRKWHTLQHASKKGHQHQILLF